MRKWCREKRRKIELEPSDADSGRVKMPDSPCRKCNDLKNELYIIIRQI